MSCKVVISIHHVKNCTVYKNCRHWFTQCDKKRQHTEGHTQAVYYVSVVQSYKISALWKCDSSWPQGVWYIDVHAASFGSFH